MFFELPEVLVCPRCGPPNSLILLVREARERRVHTGWLGCPNCGEDYPVVEGVADLRTGAGTRGESGPFEAPELAVKVAALSGLRNETGFLVLDDHLSHVAEAVSDLLAGVEVVALNPELETTGERAGVSRILCDSGTPLMPYRFQGAAIVPASGSGFTQAVASTVAPGARLVALGMDEARQIDLEELGFEVLVSEKGIAVAERVRYGPVELARGRED